MPGQAAQAGAARDQPQPPAANVNVNDNVNAKASPLTSLLRLVTSSQLAKTWLPPLLRAVSIFLLITALLLYSAFIASNHQMIQIDLILTNTQSTIAWWSLYCVGFGFCLSATVFYIRQHHLLNDIQRLRQHALQIDQDRAMIRSEYDRLKSLAAQVLIPYPLDQLHEQVPGLNPQQITDVQYKPRLLRVSRHDSWPE